MKVKKQLLIFVALVLLLMGVVCATDVSDETTDTVNMAEDAVQETQQATDMNNIETQENEEKNVEIDTSPENDVTTTQSIQKKTNKDNTKEATEVSSWEQLKQTIEDATEDTTITLGDNLINEERIIVNNGRIITINGNGKTINGAQNQVFYIYSGSTLILKNIIITNAKSSRGGAIENYGTLTITQSTLANNTATSSGGAIYSHGYANITGNIFSENTADDKETNVVLTGVWTIELKDNQYKSTDISLYKIELSLKDDKQPLLYDEDIELEFTLALEMRSFYDEDILEKLDRTIYINGEENVTTTSDSFKLSHLKPGTYSIYYSSCNQQSNTVTFNIINRTKENDVYNYTQLIDAVNEAKTEGYSLYTINLHPGNYNATDSIDWGDSSTHKIIINGNGITLDGNNTYQFINITNGHNNLTLNNVTITNYTADFGGAIDNYGTLTITDSTLTNNIAEHAGAIYNVGTLSITDSSLNNNTATQYGGAIRNNYGTLSITHTTLTDNNALHAGAIWNYGTLTITDSTLINNTATHYAGAIYNSGTLTITDSTLANSTANIGGAIHNNYGRLNIIHTTLANNTASEKGGAISNIYQEVVIINEDPEYINVINSNFIKNHAGEGGAIFSLGYANLTGNIFSENTADNKETIDLYGWWNGIFDDNQYISTDISLKAIELSVNDNKETFETGEDVTLNFNIELEHPQHYDSDILEKTEINKTLYVNGVENVTTNNTNYTLSNLSPGKYTVNYNVTNGYSNNVTFIVIGNSEIKTDKEIYYYYDGIKDRVTLTVTDLSGEKGTADIRVKDGDKYQEIIICPNVKDGYAFSTEILNEALENLYADELGDSYTINVTYTGEYAHPSSTEFTLNIIKQRNTTILYDILNNTEGNVQIYIIVLDDIYRTPVPDAAIKITGDITQTATSGIITDTALTPGSYTISVLYDETDNYKSSQATINFDVEIDKDKKIQDLEEQIDELTAPKETTLTIDEIMDVKYGDEITITGILVNEDGFSLSNQNITIKFNNEETNVTTRSGEFRYTTTAAQIGENTVTATYVGNDKNKESGATYTFEVAKADTNITITPIEAVKKGESVTVTGTLVDHNGNKLANSVVRLLINNGRKTLRTDADGVYTFDYTLTRIGENTITATYNGSDFYNEATESITVEVKPLATTIVIDPMDSVIKGTKASITGTLTDENGDAVANAVVKLSINGSQKTLTTDSEGKFTHNYTMGKLGDNTITAEFVGNKYYEAAETATTVEVTKAESVIALVSVESDVKGSNVTFTGKLTGADGVAIANAQVKIMINGSPKTLKTDASGVFSHTFKMTKEGTNNITAVFNGNNYYNACETATSLLVLKVD